MKNLIITLFAFSISLVSNAQDKSYIIIERDNKPLIYATFLIMNNKSDHSLCQKFVKKEEAIKLYGEKVKRTVLLVKLKENTSLLSQKEIYEEFKISLEDRKLPIVVDNVYVRDTENIVAVKSDIVYVKAERHPKTHQKVLHIRTSRPLHKPTY